MYKFAINYVIVIRKALVTHAKIRNAFLNPVPLYLSSIKIPQKTKESLKIKDSLEATTRFELVIRVLQTHALPLGYVAIFFLCIETILFQ